MLIDSSILVGVRGKMPTVAVCTLCAKNFLKERYLNAHQKRFHPEVIQRKDNIVLRVHSCITCGKRYSQKKHLTEHEKRIHSKVSNRQGNVHCQEEGCDSSFPVISLFRDHLQSSHGHTMEHEKNSFGNVEDCFLWICTLEKEQSCTFVNSTGSKRNELGTRSYFYCNRGGKPSRTEDPKRRTKKQGSAKIGHHCTASIVMRVDIEGRVQTDFCKTHYNHATDLAHLRISKRDKGAIAGKLSLAVAPKADSCKATNSVAGNFEHIQPACIKKNSMFSEITTIASGVPSTAQDLKTQMQPVTNPGNKIHDEKLEKAIALIELCLAGLKSGTVSPVACDIIYSHATSIKATLDNVSMLNPPPLVPCGSKTNSLAG